MYICMYVYDKGMFMESFVLQIASEQLSDNKYSWKVWQEQKKKNRVSKKVNWHKIAWHTFPFV